MSEMTTLFKKEVRKYTTEVFQNFNELAPKTPIDNEQVHKDRLKQNSNQKMKLFF